MKHKKGAGAIIAWVLLVGLTISLATTVFLWMTKQTEELSESAIRFVEGGMQCDNIMMNVAVEDPASCGGASCCFKITNTRYLNIDKVIIRGIEGVQSYTCPDKLNVQDSIFCGQDWSPETVNVMPVLKVNDDFVGCKNKAVTIEC